MGGITVAHHESNDSFTQQSSFPPTRRKSAEAPVMTEEQINQLLVGTTPTTTPGGSPGGVGLEDLTGEVQNLMMREWLDPWSSASTTPSPTTDLSDFDAHQLSLQLESFFTQDPLEEGLGQSPFYDEMTFVPENDPFKINETLSVLPTTATVMPPPVEQFLEPQQQIVVPVATEEEDIVEVEADEEITIQELDATVPLQNQVLHPPPQPQQQFQQPILEPSSLKRRRGSSSSESSSSESESEDDDDEEEDDDDDNVIPTTVANMSNRQRYWSDSSDSDSEDESPSPGHHHRSRASSPLVSNSVMPTSAYAYMHKRQIEETLLSKITNQLQQDKLPGILAILSSENNGEDEVEIDLSRLEREQLVRLLCYVEACVSEQNGGPAVNVADYIVKEKQQQPKKKQMPMVQSDDDDDDDMARAKNSSNRRRRGGNGNNNSKRSKQQQRKRQTRQELTEDILAGDDSDEDEDEDGLADKENQDELSGLRGQGPMSMAELSKRQDRVRGNNAGKNSKNHKKSRKRVKKRSDDDAPAAVSSSSALAAAHIEGSIAVSRPKRNASQRKRRVSDESDAEDGRGSNSSSGSELIVYGNEQMDFNVKDNQTIVHESSVPAVVVPIAAPAPPPVVEEEDDDMDEEIDIML